MTLTHGSSSDHQPDLQPVVLELPVSPEGGVPVVSKRWDGHSSGIEVFQARAQALRTAFKNAPSPRSLSADAQLSHEDHASNRHALGLITRLPTTIGPVSPVITQALTWDTWPPADCASRSHNTPRRCPLKSTHPPRRQPDDGSARCWKACTASG
jgi:hypothetical protein